MKIFIPCHRVSVCTKITFLYNSTVIILHSAHGCIAHINGICDYPSGFTWLVLVTLPSTVSRILNSEAVYPASWSTSASGNSAKMERRIIDTISSIPHSRFRLALKLHNPDS